MDGGAGRGGGRGGGEPVFSGPERQLPGLHGSREADQLLGFLQFSRCDKRLEKPCPTVETVGHTEAGMTDRGPVPANSERCPVKTTTLEKPLEKKDVARGQGRQGRITAGPARAVPPRGRGNTPIPAHGGFQARSTCRQSPSGKLIPRALLAVLFET